MSPAFLECAGHGYVRNPGRSGADETIFADVDQHWASSFATADDTYGTTGSASWEDHTEGFRSKTGWI